MKTAGLGLPFNALCTIYFFVYDKRLLIVIVRERVSSNHSNSSNSNSNSRIYSHRSSCINSDNN